FLTAINSKEITKINWRDYYNWSGDTTFFIDDNIREIPSVILRECIKSRRLAIEMIKNNKLLLLKSLVLKIARISLGKRKK
ncbi:glycosyl transferase, partial [Salmonella enterica subsp. enterica serovar Nima]|nr:glycosyl transferase [Salmonella enterica subsp. enterica serovar Nima]